VREHLELESGSQQKPWKLKKEGSYVNESVARSSELGMQKDQLFLGQSH